MKLLIFVLLSCLAAQAYSQDIAPKFTDYVKFLKDVAYPFLQNYFGATTSWTAFGIPCRYQRTAGFYRWSWRYAGTITCDGLGSWNKGGCKSRSCAFKEPAKQYLAELARQGKATKAELVNYINTCNCGIDAGDRQDLVNSINQA